MSRREKEKEFREYLAKIISVIQGKGVAIDSAEIIPSNIIIRPADMTLEETKLVFCGDGLIEGCFPPQPLSRENAGQK